MTQKLDIKSFALASAFISGFFYIICALLSWVNPKFIISMGNYLSHSIDLMQIIDTSRTLFSILIGLILTLVLAYLIGGLFAWTYNKLIK
jgi:hypothetical protein